MSRRPVGLEAIILYKLIKAAVEVLLGIAAVILIANGMEAGAATLAEVLLEHFKGGWALDLAPPISAPPPKDHAKPIASPPFAPPPLPLRDGLPLPPPPRGPASP